jgi:hypothetical protein
MLRPRVGLSGVLVTEPQFLNKATIRLNVDAPQIAQKAAPLAYHFQEAAAAVVVLTVDAKVVREIVDTLGQHGDLNLGGAGVTLVLTVLLNRACFVERHFLETAYR